MTEALVINLKYMIMEENNYSDDQYGRARVQDSPELIAYYKELETLGAGALWTVANDIEPWEPNLTTLKDFHGKWENLIPKGTPIPTPESKKEKKQYTRIGVFEGAGYSMKGVYRGVQRCRMRDNTTPEFCPVCIQAIKRLIDFYTK